MDEQIYNQNEVGQKHLNSLLLDTLHSFRQEDGCLRKGQLNQGHLIAGFEIEFQNRWHGKDPFTCLASKSREIAGLGDYTDRHFRNLRDFASLFDSIEKLLVEKDQEDKVDSNVCPPNCTMTHYLIVDVKGLKDEKKLMLLRLAEQNNWTVKMLGRRVKFELGIKPQPQDTEFDKAIRKTEASVTRLKNLIGDKKTFDSSMLTRLWKLNSLIGEYGKAVEAVAPEGMQASVPVLRGKAGQKTAA